MSDRRYDIRWKAINEPVLLRWLSTTGERSTSGRMLNVSERGALLAVSDSIGAGQTVECELTSLKLSAKVTRCKRDSRVGYQVCLHFAHPGIDPDGLILKKGSRPVSA